MEDMTKYMVKELTEGCNDDPTIQCGFIGEVGCSYPLLDVEKRSIQASAEAQQAMGGQVPVSFHPGRNSKSPFEILRIFSEAGGKIDRTIMSHVERTLQTPALLSEFASGWGKSEPYCQFDLFGIEVSYYQIEPSIDFPNDAQRIQWILHLLENENKEDRILASHDIHTKHRLERYGGHGFKHLLKYAIPKMIERGITQEQVDKIFIKNPAKILAYH